MADVHQDHPVSARSGSRRLRNGWQVEEVSRSETDYLYREIVEDQLYFSAKVAPHAGTIVDVGANIGLFSMYASDTWTPQLIIAIEAIPDLRAILRRNLSGFPQVHIPDVAAGSGRSRLEFVYYPRYSMMSGRRADPKDDFELVRAYARGQLGDQEDPHIMRDVEDLLRPRFEPSRRWVDTLPLDEICGRVNTRRIDLLKIDVEGDEFAVLQGLGDLDVRNVVVEVDERRVSLVAVRSLLRDRGLSVTERKPPGYRDSPLSVVVGSFD